MLRTLLSMTGARNSRFVILRSVPKERVSKDEMLRDACFARSSCFETRAPRAPQHDTGAKNSRFVILRSVPKERVSKDGLRTTLT